MQNGLYETLITDALSDVLSSIDEDLLQRSSLRNADAPDRIALHLAKLVEAAVSSVDERQRAEVGLKLARELAVQIALFVEKEALSSEAPVLNDSVLSAIMYRNPDGSPAPVNAPMIPLLDTTLLTNSPGEPRIGRQLETEIESATSIDVIMAFIRRSGIRPLLSALRHHCERGRPLRILTTTYTNSTEQLALEQLAELGADVRVSYDTSGTRLHAKAWLFHRPGDMSTAYIGSSNLTHQAQHTGLEWNVRVSGIRNAAVVDKMSAVFESYYASSDFKPYVAEEFAEATTAEKPVTPLAPIEIRLYPYQERMLEQIAVARSKGQNANLLVAATGTGKTVMAAVDYARLAKQLGRARLLFVAHTKEILQQSQLTFRYAVRDGAFGELWVDGEKPTQWQHVFASIQSLSANGLAALAEDHFDVVIIDEIHHGAAKSYETLLQQLKPKQLLGLTATPERADGQDILQWFGGRIAAELRLWDAIDQHRLVPFEYWGIHDNTDLNNVPWKRGRGYDPESLVNVYTADEAWAKLVISQLQQKVDDAREMKALGFCVNVAHAKFMADVFTKYGISAVAISGNTPRQERQAALNNLRRGLINIMFSVDLFNEGVDIPNVDTLLLLRPTESPVLFLQQLGRGLRKAEGKVSCTVLDFIGQHRKEFRFHSKLQAFIGGSRKHVERQVEQGFPFLPTGCHMELEAKARDIVLRSIRNAIPSNWPRKVEELRALAAEGVTGLSGFLEHSGLELADIYSKSNGRACWSDLKAAAGLDVLASGPAELTLRRAVGRLQHVNDAFRLNAYRRLLNSDTAPLYADVTTPDARIARMLVGQLCDSVDTKLLPRDASLQAGLSLIWQHPQIRAELLELFDVLETLVDHLNSTIDSHPDAPLQVMGRYTRIEILAALEPKDLARPQVWREGVRWLSAIDTDVMAFTLDKTDGQFSPTTRYNDYAITPELIHWETQSTVSAVSPTAKRYLSQRESGAHVMLFAREDSSTASFWLLGTAGYESHEEGKERPMAIVWRLQQRLPGDLFAAFAAAVA